MQTATKTEPSLRFPEYAGHWREVRLHEFLIPTLRAVPKPKDQFLAVGIRSHCRGTFRRESLDPEDISMDTLYVVREGDLTVNITFAWEGAIAIAKAEDDGGLVSHRFPTYVFNQQITGPDFFQHVFVQRRFRYFLKVISPGGAGRNRVLDKKDFLRLAVRLPEPPEQEKISAFLSAVDEKIRQLVRKKELLLKYKKGAMQQLFGQKIRFKDDNGHVFPDWEEKSLGTVAQYIRNGLSLNQELDDGAVKVTRIETISDGKINIEKVGFIKTEEDISEYRLQVGDILFSNINSVAHIGKMAYVDQEYDLYHGMNLLNIRFDRKSHNSQFFYFLMETFEHKKHFQRICNRAVSQASINQTDLKKTKLLVPCLDEQSKIASFLAEIDTKISNVTQQLEAMNTFKKGLLQQMFV